MYPHCQEAEDDLSSGLMSSKGHLILQSTLSLLILRLWPRLMSWKNVLKQDVAVGDKSQPSFAVSALLPILIWILLFKD